MMMHTKILIHFLIFHIVSVPAAQLCSQLSQIEQLQNEVSKLQKSLSPTIIGEYADKVFRQSCKIETKEGNEISLCSSTFADNGKIITAGHCPIKPRKSKVTCFCGVDPKTKNDVFTTSSVKSASIHPNYSEAFNAVGLDVQVVELIDEINCGNNYPPIKPWSAVVY